MNEPLLQRFVRLRWVAIFLWLTSSCVYAQNPSASPTKSFLGSMMDAIRPSVPSYVDPNVSVTDALRSVFLPAPITLTLRQSHVNSGYAAQVTNTGQVPISVTVRCNSNSKSLTLDPNKEADCGWFEGVPIHPKNTVTATVEGDNKYRDLSVQAP